MIGSRAAMIDGSMLSLHMEFHFFVTNSHLYNQYVHYMGAFSGTSWYQTMVRQMMGTWQRRCAFTHTLALDRFDTINVVRVSNIHVRWVCSLKCRRSWKEQHPRSMETTSRAYFVKKTLEMSKSPTRRVTYRSVTNESESHVSVCAWYRGKPQKKILILLTTYGHFSTFLHKTEPADTQCPIWIVSCTGRSLRKPVVMEDTPTMAFASVCHARPRI
jgi:hypothetical protein